MRKAFNLYANGDVRSGKELIEIDSINKTDIGTWVINDCLDFNEVDWRYSFPQEDQNIVIEHGYNANEKTLSLFIKKDSVLYDPRGITVAVNYKDTPLDQVASESLSA
ncbi:hypothetical protein [Marinicellulosiphila megalodicopiae]|uniref:hypothetical protein n=1 Tax=Marinicellulosiphila megalodicopiae TaxID=2724896 RepID=UPI003BAE6167